jgi:quercetin dioxygenase-like cupin family protein
VTEPPGDLRDRLRAEGLDVVAWSNAPGDRYGAHKHGYDKVIVVEAGSIRYGVPDGADAGPFDLARGDRLELPAGTNHEATVGPNGVTCLEAHLLAGTVPALARRAADTW